MAAQLTLEKDNTDKVVKYIDELKSMSIELLPPDINRSDLAFGLMRWMGKMLYFWTWRQ